MNRAEKLAAVRAETRRMEQAMIRSEIRLALLNDKIAAHERAEARQLKSTVQAAVAKLVQSGQIAAHDHSAQLDMAGQLIADPAELIPLALTPRIFRQRNGKAKA